MNEVQKVWPVVLRDRQGRQEILAFRHPLAGLQLVKGTIEPGEAPDDAAVREMVEESGLVVTVHRSLGSIDAPEYGQVWHVYECRHDRGDLPERWQHWTEDGGGHLFAFFWHALSETPGEDWHPMFVRVLEVIARRVRKAR